MKCKVLRPSMRMWLAAVIAVKEIFKEKENETKSKIS